MPGQLYHEDIDAQTYADWGIDYLKSDNCASYALDPSVRFGAMRDALVRHVLVFVFVVSAPRNLSKCTVLRAVSGLALLPKSFGCRHVKRARCSNDAVSGVCGVVCASYCLFVCLSVWFVTLQNRTGRKIVFSIEPFSVDVDPEQSVKVSNLWRIHCDISSNYHDITNRADISDKWSPLAGSGGWNDPGTQRSPHPRRAISISISISLSLSRFLSLPPPPYLPAAALHSCGTPRGPAVTAC